MRFVVARGWALIAAAVAPLLAVAAIFAGITWCFFLGPSACLTEVHRRISDVSGLDFEIRETDCDTLAKEGWVGVFASRLGQPDEVLVFEYVPSEVSPLPRISSADPQTVLISIPAVSSIHLRHRSWDGITIDYDIGAIDYPGVERSERPTRCRHGRLQDGVDGRIAALDRALAAPHSRRQQGASGGSRPCGCPPARSR